MARNAYGLDLGSYDIKGLRQESKIRSGKRKNVLAVQDNRDRDIFAVGDDAYQYVWKRLHPDIEVAFPMRGRRHFPISMTCSSCFRTL